MTEEDYGLLVSAILLLVIHSAGILAMWSI